MKKKPGKNLPKRFHETGEPAYEAEFLKLIHELEVHQLELEMQNDELKLSRSSEHNITLQYTELYDFAPVGYVSLSASGEILKLNLAFANLLGKPRSKLVNRIFSVFITFGSLPVFESFLLRIFETRALQNCELVLRTEGNIPRSVLVSGISNDDTDYCLINVFDITTRKKAEEEIRLKNEELIQLHAEKDRFYGILAHDLRSPFNSLLGLTQILADDLTNMEPKVAMKIAEGVRNSSLRIYNLLENLLKWSRVNLGLIQFGPESMLLKPLITDIILLEIENAKRKNISISKDFQDSLTVFADRDMLNTILRNLISNAMKFTPFNGQIIISAGTTGSDYVEISIIDTGIGMSRTMVENLFRLDRQTNREGTDGESSSGFGLLLCQELIRKHKGNISVESEEGKGSRFTITLPVPS